MKQSKKLMTLPLFYALMLTACNNNNSIPSSYIGFKNTQQTITYDPAQDIQTFSVTIISGEKMTEDTRLSIRCSGQSFAHPEDNNPIFPKGKKEMSFNIKLNPKKINVPFLNISCTPQVKDSQTTKMTVALKRK